MQASLPMYDLPVVRAATDALWRALARAFRRAGVADVPDRLTRDAEPAALWSDPRLLLSQSCGFPLIHGFAGRLRPVATARYAAPGCDGPNYRSAVIVHADAAGDQLDDFRGAVCAVNGWDSQSGWNALAALAAPLAGRRGATGFFRSAIVTGGHCASVAAVAGGAADLAAIDAVTLALLGRHRPETLSAVRVLTWTQSAPGLPFVTRADADDGLVARLRDGLAAMLEDPAAVPPREALLLSGLDILELPAYRPIRHMASRAAALGRPPALAS
ncbi:MAG: PhnD/SsuA/transferrin family substrate-binding protein [Alphaproteobacteria bacterium]